jgi:hypothetical protein
VLKYAPQPLVWFTQRERIKAKAPIRPGSLVRVAEWQTR